MSNSEHAGMTVNERLVVAGLIGEWDAAVNAHDRARMIAVLDKVGLESQSAAIADQVLANPERYGF